MTPVFAARRRADEFAALVEAPSTGGPRDARYDDLLQLVGTLRVTAPVTPRPEFVADLRQRLMTAADTALVPDDTERLTLPPRRSARERRIAVAVGGFALVGATTSMAMAAQSALPGDVLYPVKRAMESAQTGISFGEGEKGAALLANASGRLDEVSALSSGADAQDTIAIADTLDVFADQAGKASDLLLADYAENGHQGSVSELRDFTAASLAQLTALEPVVPDAAQDELFRAAQVLLDIDAAARRACPACAGSGITEIPPVFAPTPSAVEIPDATGSLTRGTGKHKPGAKHQGRGTTTTADPGVPAVDGDPLTPGSVLKPSSTTAANGTPKGETPPPPSDDPVSGLTNPLTGGGNADTSSPPPAGEGDLVDELGDLVGETLDPVTGELLP
jgi:hypothetical protein